MKKYFVTETDEQVVLGDVVTLTFFKELNDGKVTVEKDVEFNEDTMDMIISMGFVTEREEDGEDTIDFGEPCEQLSDLFEDFKTLEQRFNKLEAMAKEVYKAVEASKNTTAQPKKK